MDKQNGAIILDTTELTCLMQARPVGAIPYLGINAAIDFPGKQLQKARNSLQSAGLLNQSGQITAENLPMFDGLFFPERSLAVVRDLPDKGRQELTFLNRKGITILYSRPNEKTHRLETISLPEQTAELLKDFFQLGETPTGERISIPTELLDALPDQVAAGEIAAAKQALMNLKCEQIEKDLLLQAVQNRKISGSIAILDLLEDGEVVDGFSLAILANDQSAWLFHQPTSDGKSLIAQRNSALFSRFLDIFPQRLTGGTMLSGPLDKTKIVSFSLNADEFAFCFAHNDRKDIAQELINTHFPETGAGQAEFERRMREAGDSLAARGWSQANQNGQMILAQKLASAISSIVQYTFVLQVSIARPNLSANATVHVLGDQLFTSVIRSDQDVYFLEHGDFSVLPAYLSKLFLDFGQGSTKDSVREDKVAYATLVETLGQTSSELSSKVLAQAGMDPTTANLLAQDMAEAAYQGTLIRINVDSHASQEVINAAVKPLMLLLRGQQRSWLYSLVPAEDKGSLILINNRDAFLEQLSKFTA